MATLITVLIIITCILLSLIVLVQNPKGGGLASGFGGASQIGGVQKTNDFLEKATWTLAIFLVILSISTSAFNGAEIAQDNGLNDQIELPQQQVPAQEALPSNNDEVLNLEQPAAEPAQ
ncbi:MAG: preprotein translocase subunit SecG [Flavobacteriales bacterium]|jgi:preprotein translocase subunit SecG